MAEATPEPVEPRLEWAAEKPVLAEEWWGLEPARSWALDTADTAEAERSGAGDRTVAGGSQTRPVVAEPAAEVQAAAEERAAASAEAGVAGDAVARGSNAMPADSAGTGCRAAEGLHSRTVADADEPERAGSRSAVPSWSPERDRDRQ